jgi:hypothetical protein
VRDDVGRDMVITVYVFLVTWYLFGATTARPQHCPQKKYVVRGDRAFLSITVFLSLAS